MGHSYIKLAGVFKLWEPRLIDVDEWFNTIKELICIKQRHIDVVRRIKELSKMMFHFECLSFASFGILHNVEALIARDTVVKTGRSDRNAHGAIRNNLRFFPPISFWPIDNQHVICLCLSKNKVRGFRWLRLLNISHLYFEILRIECSELFCLSLVNRSFRLDLRVKGSSKKASFKHFFKFIF